MTCLCSIIPKIFNFQIGPLIGPAGWSQSFKEGNPLWGLWRGREQNVILQSTLAACQSTPEEFRRANPGMQPHLERLSDDREGILGAATSAPCAGPGYCTETLRCDRSSKYPFSLDCGILWFRHSEGGGWSIVGLFHSNISKWFILIIFRLQYVASYVKCTLKSN